MQRLIILLIRCYQYFIRPLKGPSCRFYPSCSEYALTAIQHFGLFRGLWRSTCRILRCHPFAQGGYDPILPNQEKP